MSEAAGTDNGPDFGQGVAVAKLDDAAMLRGHVGETPTVIHGR